MDRSRFIDTAPGRLIQIEGGRWAFAPHPLPPEFTLNDEQRELLAEAREVIGELRGVTSPELLTNPMVLLRPLQREESLRSSSLEGTFATPEELLRYELDPSDPKSAEDATNRWREWLRR